MQGLLIFLMALLGVIILLVVLNFNSIRSVLSIKKLNDGDDKTESGPVYTMNIYGNYFLDDMVKQGGVKNESEILSFVSRKLTYGLVNISNYDKIAGCSSFFTKNEKGEYIFARNYDYWKTSSMIIHTKPNKKGRHESFSTLDLEFFGIEDGKKIKGILSRLYLLASPYGCVDGINDAGLAIATLMTFQGDPEWGIPTHQENGKSTLTTSTLIRMALDYCTTVDEVVDMIKSHDYHDLAKMSCHFHVCDATGKSAIIEWVKGNNATDIDGTDRKLNIIYNEGNQYLTNYVISDGYYDGIDSSAMQGLKRYEILKKNVSDSGIRDEDVAMNILSKVGCRSLEFERNDVTVWSMVCNLSQKTVRWIFNEHYGDKNNEYIGRLAKKQEKQE